MSASRHSPPSTASSRKSSRSLADSDRTLHLQDLNAELEEGSALMTEDKEKFQHQSFDRPGRQGSQNGSTRRKTVAVLCYLAASTVFQLAVIRIAKSTAWPTAVSAIPAEAIFGGIGSLVWKRVQRRTTSNGCLDIHPGRHARVENAVLAGAIFLATFTNVLQAGIVSPQLSSLMQTFLTPALILLLPFIGLADLSGSNGVISTLLLVAAICAASLLSYYGSLPSFITFSMGVVLVEAAKLALLKRWTLQSQEDTQDTLCTIYPTLALLSLVVLPIRVLSSTFSPLPKSWLAYGASFIIYGILDKVATVWLTVTVESPVTLGQLAILRAGLVLTCLHLAAGAAGTSTAVLVALASLIAVVCLVITVFRYRTSDETIKTELEETRYNIQAVQFTPKTNAKFAALAFVPLLVSLVAQELALPLSSQLMPAARNPETVDIVISTFNEPAENVRSHIDRMKSYWWIRDRQPRVILYLKGNISDADPEGYRRDVGADLAIRLENKGREAGTFLWHIVNNYNASVDPMRAGQYRAGFADHTLFMQHHLAWDWIARERFWLWKPNTGYLHFAPYIKLDCGKDMDGNGDFPRITQVYSMFREELCPPTLQLGAYAAQFVVSKKRILANPYRKYKTLLDIINAEADHWIHQEGTWWHYHGKPGPENPYFGHAMERSWPIIFGCSDPKIKDTCKDVADDNESIDSCQCLD